MRPISHKTLMQKSRNFRNEEAIKKLATMTQFFDNPELFENETPPLPKYVKPKVEKSKVGWTIFFLKELLP